MSTTTSIEWTDKTWNPVRGCALVSPGCENCYAMSFAHRFSGAGKPYDGLTKLTKHHGPRWTGAARFVPEMLAEPLHWRKPARVFVNSMSDLFHEELSNEQIAAVYGVMAAASRHTFQILTKRADRMRRWFEWIARETAIPHAPDAAFMIGTAATNYGVEEVDQLAPHPWPLPNVWLGVSVEDRKHGVPRIDQLRAAPASVRWLSIEPLLEDIGPLDLRGIDWVVVGGESGPGARPFDVAWARSIVRQCRDAGVACFVKQLGAAPRGEFADIGPGLQHLHRNADRSERFRIALDDRKGGDMAEWPADLRVREFPEVAR